MPSVTFKFVTTRPDPSTAKGRAAIEKGGSAVTKGRARTVEDVVRAAREKASANKASTTIEKVGRAARYGRIDPAKAAELQNQTRQVIPTRAQVIEKGGGIGGYLRAWRELNG